MKVKAPVKVSLTVEQVLTALRNSGYDIPNDVMINLVGPHGLYGPVPKDKIACSIYWDIEVDIGGPNKCLKESGR